MTKQSQNKKVLKYLQTGKSITAKKAIEIFSIYRLASRIYDLKLLRYKVTSIKRKFEDSYFSEYKLIRK